MGVGILIGTYEMPLFIKLILAWGRLEPLPVLLFNRRRELIRREYSGKRS